MLSADMLALNIDQGKGCPIGSQHDALGFYLHLHRKVLVSSIVWEVPWRCRLFLGALAPA